MHYSRWTKRSNPLKTIFGTGISMQVDSLIKRRALAVLLSAFGALTAWYSAEPSGLLIFVVAASVCAGWKAGLAAGVVSTLLAWNILFDGSDGVAEAEPKMIGFVVCVICLWLLVHIYRSVVFFDQIYATAQPSMEDIPGLGWSAYPDGRMRFVNPAALSFVGVSATEMSELAQLDNHSWWSRFVHPDDVDDSIRRWLHSMKTGEPLIDEQRVRRADGTYRWFRDSAIASRDAEGRITGWYGMAVDIDDQRKAEAALQASEQQLREMIDTVPALIWRANPDGTASYINKPLMEWTGLRLADTDGWQENAILKAIHPDDRCSWQRALRHSFETGEPFALRYRQRRADGAYRWMDGKAEALRGADGKIIQWYGVCLDVTDEVEAMETVRQSERELRLLVDTVPTLIWLITPEGMPYYFNKRFVDWTGARAADLLSYQDEQLEAHEDLLHPDEKASVAQAFREALKAGQPLHLKGRLRRKDGEYRWLDSRVEPLRDESGNIIRWYGVSFDIDEEVRAQTALRESQNYLQHLIDTVPVGIVLSNPAGEPVYLNKRLTELAALDGPGSITGRLGVHALNELIHPDDREEVHQRLKHCLQTGSSFAMRYRQRRPDGEYRWIEGRSEPFQNGNGEIVQWYGVNLDVDDEVRAQEGLRLADERLSRASQAASLAELSISIAHQLNQPLQAVVSNASALQRWLAAKPPALDRVGRTAASIMRDAAAAAEVVTRIRALFSNNVNQRRLVNINEIIREACDLITDRTHIGTLRIEFDLDTTLPATLVDRVQIEQVIINLLRNAIEAMKDVEPRFRYLRMSSRVTPNEMVEVAVRDFGSGLSEPERIFEPFYTTKPDGMGMGLAICRTIIEAHGGHLRGENGSAGGASVSFAIPIRPTSSVIEHPNLPV